MAKTKFAIVPSDSFDKNFAAAYERYRGTMKTFARHSVRQLPGMDIEDIEQELCIVLARCVQNYDPDRGGSFNTLFQGSAVNQIRAFIRSANTQKRKGDYLIVDIDNEDLQGAIASASAYPSAEEIVMAHETVSERYAKSA